jgi:hypothetical protein
MNTFERNFGRFPTFVNKVLGWRPDFIVPVAKKGCKLLKSYEGLSKAERDLIKYKLFFELSNQTIQDKRIAVVDDATQYTSTLLEYRRFFENLGGVVRTFSYVGHDRLFEGKRWQYDEQAEVEIFLPDAVYQEYILQQSYYLLDSGNNFDLDHLIFEFHLPTESLGEFLSCLREAGELLSVESYFLKQPIERFNLNNPTFFRSVPGLSDPSIAMGPLRKIKFNYDANAGKLRFSPLVFPTWHFGGTEFGNKLFRDVAFRLPFETPRLVDQKNKGALLRVYNNIYFAYAVSLAKAFVQFMRPRFDISNDLQIRRNDLDAVLGRDTAGQFLASATSYICNSSSEDFSPGGTPVRRRKTKVLYRHFGDVLDSLKAGYLKKVKEKKTRLGVHFFLPYGQLFNGFKDRCTLLSDLDYYCDFGVVVPETLLRGNRFERAIRSGEPKSEYSWERTQVLIPLAIEQCSLGSQSTPKNTADPMALNKILSNFVFDYPSEVHHELHCLLGKPHTFGTLVHAYHHHRASSKPSLYSSDRISPFYRWDQRQKRFTMRGRQAMLGQLRRVFDERQEVPYSEIVSYFKLLSRIYGVFRKVDVLNMLSICREENYFYSHVVHNLRSWLESYGLHLDVTSRKRKNSELNLSGTHASSALEKIALSRRIDGVMGTITRRFGEDVEFVKIVDMMSKSYVPFTAQFRQTVRKLEAIAILQTILTNISLFVETRKPTYYKKLEGLDYGGRLRDVGVIFSKDLTNLVRSDAGYSQLIDELYSRIMSEIDSLAAEEPLLATRIQIEGRRRAVNIATSVVYKLGLTAATFLYMDFTGLRTIPEPKEETIAIYYSLVESAARRRGGIKLYGGHDGDDAFTYLFTEVEPALRCAMEIKKAFSENLFLRSGESDIKFGLSYTLLPVERKEHEILNAWGIAKDCCEYKSGTFRNRGDLLVSHQTLSNLGTKPELNSPARFEELNDERLKGGLALFRFVEMKPLQ